MEVNILNNNLIENNNEIIIYTTDDGQVEIEVRLEDENVLAYSKFNGRII